MFRNPSPASASTSHMSDDDDFEPAPAKRKRMKLPREAASSKKKDGDKQEKGRKASAILPQSSLFEKPEVVKCNEKKSFVSHFSRQQSGQHISSRNYEKVYQIFIFITQISLSLT